jgi:hypothetical protein
LLPIVVLKAMAVMGASSVLIWGTILGRTGMMLSSSALALGCYFFFAIAAFPHHNRITDKAPTRLSNGRALTAVCTGFVLCTAMSAVASGVFPGGALKAPDLLAWSVIAMGIGFMAQILTKRWPVSQIGIYALLSNVILLAGHWSMPKVGIVTSMVALAVLTFCLISLLRETASDSDGTTRVTIVRWLVVGGVTAFLLFAACLYLGYSAIIVWGLSAVGCAILIVARRLPSVKAAHVT